MKNRKSSNGIAVVALVFIVGFLGVVSGTLAQTPEEATRRLWDTAFINSGKPNNKTKRRTRARAYRIATPNIPTTGVDGDTVVGVTLWRLRRSTPTDSGERLIVHEGREAGQWLPERISPDTKLAQGDRLRISVEAARTGNLYVIDREQYADGSLGEPHLIFPTTRTLNGNNQVKVGKLIEIPAQEDSPPYFTLRRSRPDQVAEVLSVLVTPAPLEGIQITDKEQQLAETLVATWEKQWGTRVGLLELEKGAGKTWSKEEKAAGADPTKALTSQSPAPQVLYYRPNARSTEPVLIKVRLRYGYSGTAINRTSR